jgi:sterol desaturase/sphingolipid hydroxylase (fatty acid hydroxylase superfamily)
MHAPRFPKEAFHGHTIVHHGIYKGDESFFLPEAEHPEHILLKPYALPGIVIAHLPVMYLIDRYLIHHTMIGALAATILYFVVYEYMHWNMHVPRKKFVERFRWFQFLRNHHKLHHRYYQKNFCVLFPLADVCFGTMITEESLARKKAERERAIDNGAVQTYRDLDARKSEG